MKYSFLLIIACCLIASCGYNSNSHIANVLPETGKKVYTAEIQKDTYPEIRTPKGANQLDMETPMRCYVNWETQQLISTIPYNLKAFNLVNNDIKDSLPRFEVNGFSFDTMSAEKALLRLTKEAGLKLVAKDAPYTSISAENLHGDFSTVVDNITNAAEIYYTYNANNKTLRISRNANFSLYVPHSRTIMLAVLDVLRGAGITDFTANFDEFAINFDADFELKNKITNLIGYFEENPTLLAYDVKVYNLIPYNKDGIEWQQIMQAFDFGSIKDTKPGVLGRILVTSNEINENSLTSFLSKQAKVEIAGEGKFAVPNQWFSRFDVGKCIASVPFLEDLSILAKAEFEKNNKTFSRITLENKSGEIAQYSIRNRIGENFLIIGIPSAVFDKNLPTSEIVIMIVPRVIKTVKTQGFIKNNL